ncbi:hypothetical protein STRDD12_00982 [Streptococcus sp. DD12]|nr:hypothetical protein STRDD12_00982 [Streptococcus sp. DD12]
MLEDGLFFVAFVVQNNAVKKLGLALEKTPEVTSSVMS